MPRCVGKTNGGKGKRCTKNSVIGSLYCPIHMKLHGDNEIESTESLAIIGTPEIDEEFHDTDPLADIPIDSTISMDSAEIDAEIMQMDADVENLSVDIPVVTTQNDQSLQMELRISHLEKTEKALKKALEEQTNKHNDMKQLYEDAKKLTIIQSVQIKELEHKLIKLKSTKEKEQPQNKSKRQIRNIEYLAKFMLYHKLKSDADVVQEIKEKLETIGLCLKKQTKTGDTVIEKDVIPWMYVKQYADIKWSTMTKDEKDQLLDATKEKYMC